MSVYQQVRKQEGRKKANTRTLSHGTRAIKVKANKAGRVDAQSSCHWALSRTGLCGSGRTGLCTTMYYVQQCRDWAMSVHYIAVMYHVQQCTMYSTVCSLPGQLSALYSVAVDASTGAPQSAARRHLPPGLADQGAGAGSGLCRSACPMYQCVCFGLCGSAKQALHSSLTLRTCANCLTLRTPPG
jgi:hypothetical protein